MNGQRTLLGRSMQETCGGSILQQGQAIAVAKNVKIQMNAFVMTAPYEVSSSLAATSLAHTRGPAGDQAAPGRHQRSEVSGRWWPASSSATMPATARSSSSMALCAAHSQDFYGAVFYGMDLFTGWWVLWSS